MVVQPSRGRLVAPGPRAVRRDTPNADCCWFALNCFYRSGPRCLRAIVSLLLSRTGQDIFTAVSGGCYGLGGSRRRAKKVPAGYSLPTAAEARLIAHAFRALDCELAPMSLCVRHGRRI